MRLSSPPRVDLERARNEVGTLRGLRSVLILTGSRPRTLAVRPPYPDDPDLLVPALYRCAAATMMNLDQPLRRRGGRYSVSSVVFLLPRLLAPRTTRFS